MSPLNGPVNHLEPRRNGPAGEGSAVKLLLDTREPEPHPWLPYVPQGWEFKRARLETGDLALAAMPEAAVVERKTPSDMASCIGAITLWNTVYLSRAIDDLKARDLPVDDNLLEHLSPVGWEHINLTGDYAWRQNRREMKPECPTVPLLLPGQ